ncbi:MAG: ATP-binding protein [Archangium sp.]|nr:ATP-binding protein [Archangium sp.]MDP3153813.1 ATP-binding protein [Archangium sp.]MDP3571105.1 ATP-binding protein [Archangium sp.]
MDPLPHPRERSRQLVLDQCRVLDTPPETDFDNLARLASRIAGCPVGLVSLIDTDRAWCKAWVGLTAPTSTRKLSFCAHAVQHDSDLVVPDASNDVRFANNPFVTGEPHVVFYAGIPLRVGDERLPVGTLCVIDYQPRTLDDLQLDGLRTLARQVELLLEGRLRENKLEDLEARTQALIATMDDGLIRQSDEGVIEWANPAAERILGIDSGQLVGLKRTDPSWQVFRPDGTSFPPHEFPSALAQTSGQPVRHVLMGVGVGAERRWIRVNATPMFRAGESRPHAVASSLADVTEVIHRQRELEAARALAEQSGRAKSEFLATMSHELRTPMNGVIGMTDLLLADCRDESQREGLNIVKESSRALLHVLNDVLDYSKIEAGGRVLVPEAFELNKLAKDTAAILGHEVSRKKLTLQVDCSQVSRPVWGDVDAMRQVLFNLVGNAVKFTEAGKVSIHAREQRDELVLDVVDEGIGIRPEDLPRLFQRFSQADTTTARRFGGSGLGLAICRRLVEGMGGSIGVDSTPGHGSRFTVKLPLAAPNVMVAAQPANDHSTGKVTRRLHVLLVEDNVINQRICIGMLTRLGHKVQLARDGFEGVAAATSGRFDLILMDVQMPVLDGLQATEQIRAHEVARGLPRMPIYALTASVLTEERSACLDAGMDQVLLKPMTLDVLQRSLDAPQERLRAVG